jgi:thiol-disulfide isomerase/thioredoxin
MKSNRIILLILALLVSATTVTCNAQGQDQKNGDKAMTDDFLEGSTTAPDFPRGIEWLNTDHAFSLADFRGKIVLLDFWTFCCINCMHVIPDLKKLEQKYAEELVVVGVHSAKFTNEKGTDAIRQAILRYGIEHPVVNDRDFKIWSSYGVNAWPSFVLINPKGKIIGVHSGEGIYEPFDQIIGRAVKYFSARGELKPGPLNLALEKSEMPKTLLSFPGKVSSDQKSKRLVITDSNNDRIIITDEKGAILDVIGSGKTGQQDGPFEEAQFNRPQGTYLDGDTLYIADTENHLVRRASLKDRTVETILGCGKQAESYNVPGVGTEVCLNSPWDVVKVGQDLYIAMAGSHQLWVADLTNMIAKPYAGSAREARIDGPLERAALAQPSGITTDGKKLYFADSETSSIRSADLSPGGEVKTTVGEDLFEYGDIDGNYKKARLQHPLGVAYHDGKVYVADTYNSKIKIIDPENRISTTYAGTGKSGYKDGRLSDAQFFEPGGLAFIDNKIYVADVNNHSIRVIDKDQGTVGTLQLSNLEKLEKNEEQEFTGRIVELPKQTIKAGANNIIFNLNLPKGYKYIENAPFSLDPSSSDDGLVKFDQDIASLGITPQKLPVTIPAHTLPGMTELGFDTNVYFCSDESGVCMIDAIRIKVPVQIEETGTSELSINVDVQPKDK